MYGYTCVSSNFMGIYCLHQIMAHLVMAHVVAHVVAPFILDHSLSTSEGQEAHALILATVLDMLPQAFTNHL